MTFEFKPDGTVVDLGASDADRAALGVVVSRERFTHVWPCRKWRRRAFRALNWAFGERGAVGAWTRTWRGPWSVRMADDDGLAVFVAQTRAECLVWERQKFEEGA